MADPKGPDDTGRDDTEEPEPRLVSHMKVDEELIGRSIVYGGASRPKRRRVPMTSPPTESRDR